MRCSWDGRESSYGVAYMQGSPSGMHQPPTGGGGLPGEAMLHTPFADAPPRLGRDEGKGISRQQPSRLLVQVRRPPHS